MSAVRQIIDTLQKLTDAADETAAMLRNRILCVIWKDVRCSGGASSNNHEIRSFCYMTSKMRYRERRIQNKENTNGFTRPVNSMFSFHSQPLLDEGSSIFHDATRRPVHRRKYKVNKAESEIC